jgi:photosystem II stability/assembly factor-like uncharacterized protein
VDNHNGWVITNSGVFSTRDSGIKWKYHLIDRRAERQPEILSLFFLDKSNGWAVGIDRQISPQSADFQGLKGIALYTKNGGRSWKKINIDTISSLFTKVYFSDRLHGWLTSRNAVYRTNDGGKTWVNKLTLPER